MERKNQIEFGEFVVHISNSWSEYFIRQTQEKTSQANQQLKERNIDSFKQSLHEAEVSGEKVVGVLRFWNKVIELAVEEGLEEIPQEVVNSFVKHWQKSASVEPITLPIVETASPLPTSTIGEFIEKKPETAPTEQPVSRLDPQIITAPPTKTQTKLVEQISTPIQSGIEEDVLQTAKTRQIMGVNTPYLTDREFSVLQYIESKQSENENPTLDDIAEHVGLSRKATLKVLGRFEKPIASHGNITIFNTKPLRPGIFGEYRIRVHAPITKGEEQTEPVEFPTGEATQSVNLENLQTSTAVDLTMTEEEPKVSPEKQQLEESEELQADVAQSQLTFSSQDVSSVSVERNRPRFKVLTPEEIQQFKVKKTLNL